MFTFTPSKSKGQRKIQYMGKDDLGDKKNL